MYICRAWTCTFLSYLLCPFCTALTCKTFFSLKGLLLQCTCIHCFTLSAHDNWSIQPTIVSFFTIFSLGVPYMYACSSNNTAVQCYNIISIVMLCYNKISIVMLCYNIISIVMLCYNIISIVMLCYNIISIVMLCYNIISIVMLCFYFIPYTIPHSHFYASHCGFIPMLSIHVVKFFIPFFYQTFI